MWIFFFDAKCNARNKDGYFRDMIRPLGNRFGASNNHKSIFCFMSDHGLEASLAGGFPMDQISNPMWTSFFDAQCKARNQVGY
jgi:hypothetical protein